MFRLLREANLRMFAQLTPAQWRRHGVHGERGKLTVQSLCRHMAAYDVNHIDQIRKIARALASGLHPKHFIARQLAARGRHGHKAVGGTCGHRRGQICVSL